MKKIIYLFALLSLTVPAAAQPFFTPLRILSPTAPFLIDSVRGGQHVFYVYGNVTDTAYMSDTLQTHIGIGFAPNIISGVDTVHDHSFGHFVDSVPIAPGQYIVNMIYTDTSGVSDTLWINIPVTVSDYWVSPTISVDSLDIIPDVHQPVVQITYNTGNTSAVLSGVIAFNSLTLSGPLPLAGLPVTLNGAGIYNLTLPYMQSGNPFSFRLTLTNAIGDTTTAIIASYTTGTPGPPSISGFTSASATTDSAYLQVSGTTGNLQTKFVARCHDASGVLLQTDTVTVSPQVGQVNNIAFAFGNLTPATTYKYDACAINTQNTICQLTMLTLPTQVVTPLLSFANLTQQSLVGGQSRMEADATFPNNGNHIINFIVTDSADVNYMSAITAIMLDSLNGVLSGAGVFPLQVVISNQIAGHKYRGSWYGNDGVTFVNLHDYELFWTYYDPTGFNEIFDKDVYISKYEIINMQGQVVRTEPAYGKMPILYHRDDIGSGIYVVIGYDKFGRIVQKAKFCNN